MPAQGGRLAEPFHFLETRFGESSLIIVGAFLGFGHLEVVVAGKFVGKGSTQ